MVFNCTVASFLLRKNTLETDIDPRLVHMKQNIEMLLGAKRRRRSPGGWVRRRRTTNA